MLVGSSAFTSARGRPPSATVRLTVERSASYDASDQATAAQGLDDRLARARREPARAFATARALLKGRLYRWYYRARGIRFRAGRNFRVFGSVSIRGPGEVIFGDNVAVFGRTTPWTYSRDARIVV